MYLRPTQRRQKADNTVKQMPAHAHKQKAKTTNYTLEKTNKGT